MNTFKELYQYRAMITSLIHRDLRGRYKGSVLGFAWTFLNPLLQLGVYTLIFSVIMRSGIEDYYLFLFVALVPWMFFSSSIAGGAGSITNQKAMVTKIYFPREVLPISYVTCQLVNMLLTFLVVFAVLILSGKGISLYAILFLPIIVIAEYLLAISFTMIASAVTVYFRDMEHILGIVTMAWQFLTPVMYSIDMVPEKIRPIFNLNPMTHIIVAYRDIFYYKKAPELQTLVSGFLFSVGLLLFGWWLFGKMKRRFAEEM